MNTKVCWPLDSVDVKPLVCRKNLLWQRCAGSADVQWEAVPDMAVQMKAVMRE